MKECSKCKEVKELSEFGKAKSNKDGLRGQCKECISKYKKEYRDNNKEYIHTRLKEWREENREKLYKYRKEWAEDNKEKIVEKRKEYYQENKCKIANRSKEYYKENKENKCEYDKKYRAKNKEKISKRRKEYREKEDKDKKREYMRVYVNERMKEDPFYKFKFNIRTLVRNSIKGKGYTKRSKSFDILGVDFETFQTYISRQFKKGMTWENHGEWHLDHIIPMASATTEEEAIKLNHYTNFSPEWAEYNLKKSDTIIEGTQITIKI